ncbi:MAG: hypothetical protein ISP46_04450, partial [Alphaproteobacteria bacterium]|nr:hypothetical protein [Alphaproteobacteria bacterium]
MRIILMMTGAVVLFLVVGIGYIWITTPVQLVEVAIIKADTKPYKIQPVNPGGEVINNIESSLLNTLDNPSDIPLGGEVLSPPDPTPELPPIDVTITADALTDDQNLSPSSAEASLPDDQIESLTDETTASDENQEGLETSSDDTLTDEASNTVTAETNQEETAPLSEERATTDLAPDAIVKSDDASSESNVQTETAETAGIPLPKPCLNRVRSETGTPLYRVQLAAFKNEQKAMQVAALLMEKHRSRLGQSSV